MFASGLRRTGQDLLANNVPALSGVHGFVGVVAPPNMPPHTGRNATVEARRAMVRACHR